MTETAGFLNTGGTFSSDLTLILYFFLLLPGMLLGYFFARRKKYEPHHKLTMTAVVILNWILIAVVMLVSYRDGVLIFLTGSNAARFAGDPRIALPTIHGVLGAVAQLLATYLAIRMWFEKVLPSWLMVKRIKRYMRFTLALWIVTITLGALIYVSWYINPLQVRAMQPIVTVEPGSTLEPGMTLEPNVTDEAILSPQRTPELTTTPARTPELDYGDMMDMTADAFDAMMDATEAFYDDAPNATRDAFRDARRATEDAIDEMMDATNDAAKRNQP